MEASGLAGRLHALDKGGDALVDRREGFLHRGGDGFGGLGHLGDVGFEEASDEACPESVSTPAGDYYVKRVIGLPGDRISIRNGHPVINGRVLSVEPYAPERLTELVAARMERQQVLSRAYVTAVIDHHVLQRCLGSPEIMAEQCAHLATVAERPNIALHVVPEGMNLGLWGAFDIAAKDGAYTVRMTTLQDVTSTSPDLVSNAMQAYERILGAAMPRAESLDFTRGMEEQWKTQI